MCGIFGWSFTRKSRIPEGQREIMATALSALNAERGRDSWGVASVSRDHNIKIVKGLGSIVRGGSLAEFGRYPVVLGHTRAATVGAVTQRNAHPFETSKLILAHNGAVYNYEEMNKKYKRECEVDSEHLVHHLAEGKEMKEIEGYGSIEFLEKGNSFRPKLVRMRMGQLAVRGIKGARGVKCGIVWSSSEYHLRTALDLAGLDHFAYQEPKEGQVYFAEAGRFFVDEKAPKIEIGSGSTFGGRVVRYRGGRSASDYEESGWGHVYGGYGYVGYQGKPANEGGWGGSTSSFCRKCDHYHSDHTGKCLKTIPDVCMCELVTWVYEKTQREKEREAKKEVKQENSKSGQTALAMLPNASRIQGVRTNILEHPELGQLAEVGNGVYCRSNGEVVELDDATIQGLREMSGVGGVVG